MANLKDNPPDKFDGVELTDNFTNDLAAINAKANAGFSTFAGVLEGDGYTAVLLSGYKG